MRHFFFISFLKSKPASLTGRENGQKRPKRQKRCTAFPSATASSALTFLHRSHTRERKMTKLFPAIKEKNLIWLREGILISLPLSFYSLHEAEGETHAETGNFLVAGSDLSSSRLHYIIDSNHSKAMACLNHIEMCFTDVLHRII